jgi:uncharacterized protein
MLRTAARLSGLLLAATLASAAHASPAPPAIPGRVEADTLRTHIEQDRKETLAWLKSAPTSYLATIERKDFGDLTTLTVGRAEDNNVRIDAEGIEPHHLRVTVKGDSFVVAAVDPAARFTVNKVELRNAVVPPSGIGIGRFSLRLSHQRYPAIIVFDPQSPRFKKYHGLEWYPVDFAYRYVLDLTPNPKADTIVILSTRGNHRRALRMGWFDFKVGHTPCRLEATRLLEPGVGENDLGLFFRDATTGKETYGLGRYVDVTKRPDGRYLLDFNEAYNPACAFSTHYNCPIPPSANRLTVAIRAGEKDSHYH